MSLLENRILGAVDRDTVFTLNHQRKSEIYSSDNILSMNRPLTSSPQTGSYARASISQGSFPAGDPVRPAAPARPKAPVISMVPQPMRPSDPSPVRSKAKAPGAVFKAPPLKAPVQAGQKVPLPLRADPVLLAALGWNVSSSALDLDVSAFLLDASGKVPGDDWFVFYGQTRSPDGSTSFFAEASPDRELISIDFQALDPTITRIVLILTIDEAFQRRQNFSMVSGAYIRLLAGKSRGEYLSFRMEDFRESYGNALSLMIGEVYLYKGQWKFSAVGGGVNKDLKGLCQQYGVRVV